MPILIKNDLEQKKSKIFRPPTSWARLSAHWWSSPPTSPLGVLFWSEIENLCENHIFGTFWVL